MNKIILALTLIASGGIFADITGGKFGMGFSFTNNQALGVFNTNRLGPIGATAPTVNLQYHITDMFAVAANVGFYTTSFKDKSGLDTTGANGQLREYQTTGWAIGLEIPIFLAKFNLLNFYIAPGFSYTPTKSTLTTTGLGTTTTPTSSPLTSTNSFLSVFAVMGLQIAINDQLHAFGRTTIGYAAGTYNSTNGTNTAPPDSTDSYFGFQSWSIGALFYFN